MQQAKAKLAQDSTVMMDPALIASLSNKAVSAPRLIAVQRTFEGSFQVNVFYDASDVQALTCNFTSFPNCSLRC